MDKAKFMSPTGSGDRIFINNGPINPVTEVDAAWSMANAEQKVRIRRADLEEKAARSGEGGSLDWRSLEFLETPLDNLTNAASENVRSGIAGQNVERAKALFHLVELVPINKPKVLKK